MTKILGKKEFSERTFIIRKMYDETQVQYAKRIGVCERTVRNWERAKVNRPLKRNFDKVQNRFEYFKTVKQGIQLRMIRKSDKEVIWSRMRDFKSMFDMVEELEDYKEDFIIKGFRRIKLVKTKVQVERERKKRLEREKQKRKSKKKIK